jgi:hypothetical protein
MFRLIALAKKYTRPLIVPVVVGASALVLTAQPAGAVSQSQPSVPPYHCQIFASEPKLSTDGHAITGVGTSMCTGTGWQDQKLVVTLEAQPLPTLFQVLAQASTDYSSSPSLEQTVSWPCPFITPGPYTIETSWYGQSGAVYSYKYPAKSLNLTCSS